MKKFFLLLVLFTSVSVFISCHSSAENELEKVKTYSTGNTLEALDGYNAQYLNSYNCSREGNKRLYVAASDIIGVVGGINAGRTIASLVGAATGGTGFVAIVVGAGLISGTAASYKAYRNSYTCAYPAQISDKYLQFTTKMVYGKFSGKSKKDEMNLEIDETTAEIPNVEAYELIELPEEYNHLKTLGMDHNAILEVSNVDGELTDYQGVCNVQKVQIGKDDFEKLEEAIGSEDFQTSYYEMLNEIPNGNSLESIACSERVKLALDKYLDLFQTYPKNVAELVEIANGYIGIIESKKEFSYEEKELIYAGIMVSVYSPQLWDNFK